MSIGGYNQLCLRDLKTTIHENSYRFQSARSSLYAYLLADNIKLIYVPNYVCDSILPAIKALGVRIKFYSVDKRLLPIDINLNERDENTKILIINYFGLLDDDIKKLVKQSPTQYIVDNSQALFSNHICGSVSIYSPRKFLGIPDGGFLYSPVNVLLPDEYFDSTNSIAHLLLRPAGEVQNGYQKFLAAECLLDDFLPKRMSQISEFLVRCIDIDSIKAKRRQNYLTLSESFDSINEFNAPLNSQVPLCYPLKLTLNVGSICKKLIEYSVYLPRYWKSDYNQGIGLQMYNNTLFLPIDERLSKQEINDLVTAVKKCIDSI
ncbi:hypothetical protein [Shewanella chilikensis]|uniref:hypothetical protein n=1 Tax=Shewanella chilikensis TaxID=558541 RepID=UPI0030062785